MADIPPGKSDSLPKRRPGSPPGRRFLGLAPGKNPAAPAGPRGAARIRSILPFSGAPSNWLAARMASAVEPWAFASVHRSCSPALHRTSDGLSACFGWSSPSSSAHTSGIPLPEKAVSRNVQPPVSCPAAGFGWGWRPWKAVTDNFASSRAGISRSPFQCSSALFRPSPCR